MSVKNVCSYASITGKNAKSLTVLVDNAIKSAKTMREKVQVASVALVLHSAKHGNCNDKLINTLIDGLGNGINRASLQDYFIAIGYSFEKNEDGLFQCTGWNSKKARSVESCDYAKSQAWWTVTKAAETKAYDMNEAFALFVKACESKIKQYEKISKDTAMNDSDKQAKLDLLNVDYDLIRKLRLINGKADALDNTEDNVSVELLAKLG